MKRLLFIAATVSTLAFMVFKLEHKERVPLNTALPDNPSFAISSNYDGKWEGERIDISGDKNCLETRVVGTIDQGKVNLRLMYNNTLLRGWVSDDGVLELYADSPRWGYRFTGVVENDHIKGDWSVTNAPCRGTWYVKSVRES